jgi:hypothetical protein
VGEVSEKLEMHFWKPKKVFVGDGLIHKNLSLVLHNYHGFGYMKISLDPIFQEFARFIF